MHELVDEHAIIHCTGVTYEQEATSEVVDRSKFSPGRDFGRWASTSSCKLSYSPGGRRVNIRMWSEVAFSLAEPA
jgi:hypothetical protein